MALVGPLGPPVGYGPAKFGARFNRQLSSIPHVCVRSLHVPLSVKVFQDTFKEVFWFFCIREEILYNMKRGRTMAQYYTHLCQQRTILHSITAVIRSRAFG